MKISSVTELQALVAPVADAELLGSSVSYNCG
ncbi:hypothetical protein FBY39_1585 [Microbacterium sp. SLBN-146]|nr:hypothetical protein FBY39_1585 [Microbacterium sp. SLBN-146]